MNKNHIKLINFNKKSFKQLTIWLCFLLTIFQQINLSQCLYEDQIGKFDWKLSYIGKLKDAYFDGQSSDKIIVATEENVLAALNTKNGDILWRKVLEKNTRGDIKFLHVGQNEYGNNQAATAGSPNENRYNSAATSSDTTSSIIITISGVSPALIRGWNSKTGNLEWEWSLTPESQLNAENSLWFYDNSIIYHVIPIYNTHLEVTAYVANTGQPIKATSSKITATWLDRDSCILSAPYFVCALKNQLIYVDLLIDTKQLLFTKSFDVDFTGKTIRNLRGAASTIIIGDDIFDLKSSNDLRKSCKASRIIFNEALPNKNVLIRANIENKSLQITSNNLENDEILNDISMNVPYQIDEVGNPEIIDVQCKQRSESQPPICRLLLASDDASIMLIQQGKIKWTREEALTNIAAVEMIDLPLSDSEGSIENELKNKDGDIIGAFVRRISSQIIQMRNLVLTVMGLGAPPSASQQAGLVRDAFGLHKMLVIVTATGKIFGLDNVSGKSHWIKYLPQFVRFNVEQNVKLFIQRSSGHFPLQAQCVIVAKNKKNGNGILYEFNPISGKPIKGDGIIELNYPIQQITLLHETKQDFLKSILLLDMENRPHVYPDSDSNLAHSMYLYSGNKETGVMSGYFIEYKDLKLNAIPIWKINLGGQDNLQKIIKIATKNPNERVHSQGRVFNDRSVLYKYINPNLVAVATHGPDNIHKYVLNVHLIDVVSGGIVHSMSHRRVKGPLHMVHSENWLVYSYYNDKVRRTEITTVELYEGKSQANSTVWSSLDAPQLPMIERQSYILPGNVVYLKETITEKGITNKHVLIALSSGSIIEMPWALLDPRRPILMANQPREEGIIPYMPELQLPAENVINYNQSVVNIKGIHAAPSGLESTCLVMVYGLDLFVTRVAPSKTFDLLKEDFDYILITIVLAALTIVSCVVKHLSSRKAIKQAWK